MCVRCTGVVKSIARSLRTVNEMGKTYKIVMVRHGESEWNQKNLFCGWYDANLSQKGKTCVTFS